MRLYHVIFGRSRHSGSRLFKHNAPLPAPPVGEEVIAHYKEYQVFSGVLFYKLYTTTNVPLQLSCFKGVVGFRMIIEMRKWLQELVAVTRANEVLGSIMAWNTVKCRFTQLRKVLGRQAGNISKELFHESHGFWIVNYQNLTTIKTLDSGVWAFSPRSLVTSRQDLNIDRKTFFPFNVES